MKKTRLFSILLSVLMLLSSLSTAVFATGSGASAIPAVPTTLPDLSVEDEENVKDGVWKVGTGYHNDAQGNILTDAGRLPAGDVGELPAVTQGKSFTTVSAWTGSVSGQQTNVLVSQTVASPVTVPSGAVGLMLYVKAEGTNGNSGLRFKPDFSAVGGSTVVYDCETLADCAAKYVYYYDATNGVWRACAPDHSFRVPDGFEGYVYMPFESFSSRTVALRASDLEGLQLSSFEIDYRWDASAFTLESVDYVVVSDVHPATLPDLSYDNEENLKEGVFKCFGGIHNNKDGSINTQQGRIEPGSLIELSAVTQGKAYTTTSVWSGSSTNTTSGTLNWINIDNGGVKIPADGVGVMVKIKAAGNPNSDNAGVRVNLKLYESAEATAQTYWAETTKNKVLYYYDSTNSVWRGFESGHSMTVPRTFHGYLYIPFESFNHGGTQLYSDLLEGMYIRSFGFNHAWQATGVTVESVEIVSVSDTMPERLPDLKVTNADNVKDGVWESGWEMHNDTAGNIVVKAGDTDNERVDANSEGALPLATQGMLFSTVSAWNGTKAARKLVDASGDNPGVPEEPMAFDEKIAVPAGAVGIMLKVNVKGVNGNSGIRVNPDFYESSEADTPIYQCVTDKNAGKHVYYYDAVNSVWRASDAEHHYRVPNNFHGYIYIPFETYLTAPGGVSLESSAAQGLYLGGVRLCYKWGTESFTLEDISFVTPKTEPVKPPKTYTVTWEVGENTYTEVYELGQMPAFKGSTDRPADTQYRYEFKGWDAELVPVTKSVTYSALYRTIALEQEPSGDSGTTDTPTTPDNNSSGGAADNDTPATPSESGTGAAGTGAAGTDAAGEPEEKGCSSAAAPAAGLLILAVVPAILRRKRK